MSNTKLMYLGIGTIIFIWIFAGLGLYQSQKAINNYGK